MLHVKSSPAFHSISSIILISLAEKSSINTFKSLSTFLWKVVMFHEVSFIEKSYRGND